METSADEVSGPLASRLDVLSCKSLPSAGQTLLLSRFSQRGFRVYSRCSTSTTNGHCGELRENKAGKTLAESENARKQARIKHRNHI